MTATLRGVAVTPTIDFDGDHTGFTISGTTVTANKKEDAGTRSATIKVTYMDGGTKYEDTVTVTQDGVS